jgi:hypothetical protein
VLEGNFEELHQDYTRLMEGYEELQVHNVVRHLPNLSISCIICCPCSYMV